MARLSAERAPLNQMEAGADGSLHAGEGLLDFAVLLRVQLAPRATRVTMSSHYRSARAQGHHHGNQSQPSSAELLPMSLA